MDVSIETPDLPLTINNYDYDGALEKTVTIDQLSFEYDYGCELEYIITMTFNQNGDSSDDYFEIPYKVKDSDGTVVDSGSLLSGPFSVGDTVRDTEYIPNMELGEDYTIEFSDYYW